MLSAINITKTFEGKTVLKNATAVAEDRGVVCLTGPSGAGKTTLLNIMAGMLPADSGEISLNGSPVETWDSFRRNCAAYLPCGCSLIESLTAAENAEFAVGRKAAVRGEIRRIFEVLGIGSAADRYPRQLSSGEYKRACFARAIALDTPYLLLDEPTGNLDEESARNILWAIRRLKDTKGFFVVTHDRRIYGDRTLCRRVFVLENAEVIPREEKDAPDDP